jgi:hypothetical protein
MFDICSPTASSRQNTQTPSRTEASPPRNTNQTRSSRSPRVEFTVNSIPSSPVANGTPQRQNTQNQSISPDNFERVIY